MSVYQIYLEYLNSSHGLPSYRSSNTRFSTYSLQDALSTSGDRSSSLFEDAPPAQTFHRSSFRPSSEESRTSYPYAFADACGDYRDVGNCTKACNGSFATMFSSLTTLHNCVLLPNITQNDNQTIVARAGGSAAAQLDTDYLLGQQYYQPSASPAGHDMLNTLIPCLEEYCTTLNGCNVSSPERFGLNTSVVYGNNGYGSFVVSQICSNVPDKILSDIGGIGVYLSYWIQVGLTLLGFAMTLYWTVVGPCVSLIVSSIRHGSDGIKNRSEQIWKSSSRHSTILTVALIDFHKVQCFFMLATNSAALVVTRSSGLEPESLQQVFNTYYFLKLIAVSGYLPITFTLFNLYFLDMLSWYLLFLSTASTILSIGTLSAVGTFDLSDVDSQYLYTQSHSGGPPKCGGCRPGVYCYQGLKPYGISDSALSESSLGRAYSILGFSLLVLISLLLYKSKSLYWRHVLRRLPWVYKTSLGAFDMTRNGMLTLLKHRHTISIAARCKHISINIYRHHITQRIIKWISSKTGLSIQWLHDLPLTGRLKDKYRQIGPRVLSQLQLIGQGCWSTFKRYHNHPMTTRSVLLYLFLYSIYILFFIIYTWYFSLFLGDLHFFSATKVYNTSWNFGQVVALSVWLPPICEYIYLELRGVRKGFEYRLRRNEYKVVRVNHNGDEEKGSETPETGKDSEDEEQEAKVPSTIGLKTETPPPNTRMKDSRQKPGDDESPLAHHSNSQNAPSHELSQGPTPWQQEVNRPRLSEEGSSHQPPDVEQKRGHSSEATDWQIPELELPSSEVSLTNQSRPQR